MGGSLEWGEAADVHADTVSRQKLGLAVLEIVVELALERGSHGIEGILRVRRVSDGGGGVAGQVDVRVVDFPELQGVVGGLVLI